MRVRVRSSVCAWGFVCVCVCECEGDAGRGCMKVPGFSLSMPRARVSAHTRHISGLPCLCLAFAVVRRLSSEGQVYTEQIISGIINLRPGGHGIE